MAREQIRPAWARLRATKRPQIYGYFTSKLVDQDISRRRCSSTAIRATCPSPRRSDMAPMTYDASSRLGNLGRLGGKELTEHGSKRSCSSGTADRSGGGLREHQRPWEKRYRAMGNRKQMERYPQPIQRHTGACDEYASQVLVNDSTILTRSRKGSLSNGYAAATSATLDHVGSHASIAGAISTSRPTRAKATESIGRSATRISPLGGARSRSSSHPGRKENLAHLPDGDFSAVGAECSGGERPGDPAPEVRGGPHSSPMARLAVITENHLGRQKCHLCGNPVIPAASRALLRSINARCRRRRRRGISLCAAQRSAQRDLRSCHTQGDRVRVVDGLTKEMFDVNAKVVFHLPPLHSESTRIFSILRRQSFRTDLATPAESWATNLWTTS